jgi:hypothetical protein
MMISLLMTLVSATGSSDKAQRRRIRDLGRHEAAGSPVVREFSKICGEIPSRLFMATMCRKYLGFRPSRQGLKRMISFVNDVARHSRELIELLQSPTIRGQIALEYQMYFETCRKRRLRDAPAAPPIPLPVPLWFRPNVHPQAEGLSTDLWSCASDSEISDETELHE